jgi:Ca-activated chloride channel family protein
MMLWYIFGREKIGATHPNALIIKHLKTPKKIWLLWLIRTLMVASLVTIIAGPYMRYTSVTTRQIPQDIMIVFDISLSMLAEDISPSRITVAKSIVRDFISERQNDRIGLIIFAGKPFVSVPFSTDTSGISSIVGGLSVDLIRQDLPGLSGTNIGDALLLANMAYSGSRSPARSIILLTDGRANIGIDPIVSAQESRDLGIRIFTVGIGSLSGNELSYTDSYGTKQYFSDGSGGRLRSDLDEPTMRRLADITGGSYHHADDRIELTQIFSDIATTLPSATESKTETKQSDLTPILLIIFILLLFIERWYLGWVMRRYRLI